MLIVPTMTDRTSSLPRLSRTAHAAHCKRCLNGMEVLLSDEHYILTDGVLLQRYHLLQPMWMAQGPKAVSQTLAFTKRDLYWV